MKIRSVFAVCAAVVALSVSPTIHASMHLAAPVHNLFAKSRIVNLSLRNDTGAPLELKVGDTAMTLATGKKVALKLPLGTRICANAATANHQAGALIAEVSASHNDATIGIR